MTRAEKDAAREDLQRAYEAASRVLTRTRKDNDLDGRLMAVAATDLEKAFVMAAHAVDKAPNTEN